MSRVRVGYFGDGGWARLALDRLCAIPELDVDFVVPRWTAPDEELVRQAAGAGIEVLRLRDVNDPGTLDALRVRGCDLMVSMSFDQILRREFLTIAPMGTVNCHAGLLPFYRGRNVLTWALINDEPEFGATVHMVDEGVDTGDILRQTRHPISDSDDYASLLDRAAVACADLLAETVLDISRGPVHRTPQSDVHPVGSICSRRRAGDEIIDWDQSARDVFNFVRALVPPGPSARSIIDDREYEIRRVRVDPRAVALRGIPGAVLGRTKDGFLVKVRDTFVEVTDWAGGPRPRVGARFDVR